MFRRPPYLRGVFENLSSNKIWKSLKAKKATLKAKKESKESNLWKKSLKAKKIFDNKISIHFSKNKTKSILFTSKRKIRKLQKLEIIHNNNRIKQHSRVTYLGCILEETMTWESMANKVISKGNARLKFLHWKYKYLISNLRRSLCNALIQPHFDYACLAWYPNLSKKTKKQN